jgi:long-chain acyl-CoA synthetase
MNIAEEIFKKTDPHVLAIFHEGGEITYAHLDAQSSAFAARLGPLIHSLPCPRVGLQCPDGPSYIALALGIVRAGGCFVPIAPGLSASERERLVNEVRLDFIVECRASGEVDIIAPAHSAPPPAWIEPLASIQPAFIRFTSGTTGRSKGIVLSHETLLARINAANQGLCITSHDRILWVLPMSHHFAVSIMLYLWHGAAIILPRSNLSGDLMAASRLAGATVLYAAPFHYQMLCGCEILENPGWRLAVSTTASLSPQVAEEFSRKSGIMPSQALGIIEVGLPCLNVPSPPMRPDSVGRPLPAFEAEVRNSQLFLRGPGCLDAYLSPLDTTPRHSRCRGLVRHWGYRRDRCRGPSYPARTHHHGDFHGWNEVFSR